MFTKIFLISSLVCCISATVIPYPYHCPPKCGVNEIYKPGCDCDLTCVHSAPRCCSPIKGCVCKPGYVRHFGVCIKSCDCPKCDCNEIYSYCGPSCQATCDSPGNEGSDKKGVPGCFCKPGYVRHHGKCIKKCDCPPDCKYSKRGFLPPKPTKPCCGKNEEYTKYAPVYPISCDNLKPHPCQKYRCGCACLPGYIRESSKPGARCIRKCDCPCYKNYH